MMKLIVQEGQTASVLVSSSLKPGAVKRSACVIRDQRDPHPLLVNFSESRGCRRNVREKGKMRQRWRFVASRIDPLLDEGRKTALCSKSSLVLQYQVGRRLREELWSMQNICQGFSDERSSDAVGAGS